MSHRLSAEAEVDLEEIWYYIATESGSVETADRLIASLTSHFLLLATFPRFGRSREEELRPGIRSLGAGEYVIFYRLDSNDDLLILHIARGSRDLQILFGS